MAVYVQVRMAVHMWQKQRTELQGWGERRTILLILSSASHKMVVTGGSGNL